MTLEKLEVGMKIKNYKKLYPDANKICRVFASIQRYIASDFPDILTFLQNICVFGLYRIICPANLFTLANLPFFTSTFKTFLSHKA